MTTKPSQSGAPLDEKALRAVNLIEKAFAAGYGIAADREIGIELDEKPYPGEEFDRGNVLRPASRPKAEELPAAERARRERIIKELLS